jgi:hypothetical protein
MEPNYPPDQPQQPGYPLYPQQPPQYPPPQQAPYSQPQQPAFPPPQPYAPPQQQPYQPPQQPYQPPQQAPYSQPPQQPQYPQPFSQPPPQAPYQTPAPTYPPGAFPSAPYPPPNSTGFPPPGPYIPDVRMGPPLAPATKAPSQRGVIITAIVILVIAVLAGGGVIAYSTLSRHSTTASNTTTNSTTSTTTVTHPTATATTQPAAITFAAQVPAADCPNDGTNGLWQNSAANGDTIQCQSSQVAVISKTPSQTNTDDEIFFSGLQGQTFPLAYQTIVFVDIGQARNACAGLLMRADSSNYARFGFYVCGGPNPNNGINGFTEVIPYDTTGKPIQNQIVIQDLPEGTKTRYSLTVHADGSTITFALDSHQVASKADIKPGQNDYVALAVDTGLDTSAGTDTTYFSNFSFASL